MELISEREAATRLARHGLSRSACQHLFATGVAGTPVRVGGMTLYDASRIDELAARAHLRADEFADAFPHGVVVARLPRGRNADAQARWPATRPLLEGPWRIGPWQVLLIRLSAMHGDGLPVVLSVSGYVLAGARIIGTRPAPEGDTTMLQLGAPGPWLDRVLGRRMRGHRGAPVELVGWRGQRVRPRDR